MSWEQGSGKIDRMLTRGTLERVAANREHADALLEQADQHIRSAQAIAAVDPAGGYQLLYDAARKALVAVLENQGLRPTSRGGHVAVLDALSAQLDPPLGEVLRPFDRLRRRRNQAEYPSSDQPAFTAEEVDRDLPKARDIVSAAAGMLDQMPPY